MSQPDALSKNEPLAWSPGLGAEVWELFRTCHAGDLAAVKRLLDNAPSIVRSHYAYRTPLYFAVRENRLAVAEHLLRRGADPLALTVHDSLLQICRDRSYADMEKLLQAHLAGACGASPDGEALAAAIREHNLAKVRDLLNASPELLHAGDERSNRPIHWAVMTRQMEMIDELLARGADLNAPRSDGARPIQLSNGDQPVIELLCSHGAARAVHLLAYSGDVQTAAAVFDARPDLADDPEALVNAAGEGHEAFVRLLLRYRPDLPKRIAFPDWSVGGKTRALNDLLFEYGLDPSQPDWLGVTPLHQFARKGDVENAAQFLDRGANLHARDEDICSTPLGWAAKFGQMSLVELLLIRGAAPRLSDDPAWATPLAWAIRREHHEIVDLLRRHGA